MADKTQPNCQFCGRPPNEVKRIITSEHGGRICNRCVDSAKESLDAGARKGNFDTKPKEEYNLRKPAEIVTYLDEYVIGQDRAKMDISIAIYNHYKRRRAIAEKLESEVEIDKSNILLLGPTGSGKTHLARAIAKMLNVPFFIGDATTLTAAGYVGEDVESLLAGLLRNADGDVERAEWGIVYLDEIDKIARKSGKDQSLYRDVSGEGVQQGLLKFLEGSKASVPRSGLRNGVPGQVVDIIDTKNILFILAGSFAGIDPIVRRRLNKSASVGFGAESKKKVDSKEVYQAIETDDLFEFGMIPELIGRTPVITSTYELTEEEMLRVLTEPKNCIVKQFDALFKMDRILLEWSPEALRSIVQEARKHPTGARALRTIVESKLRQASFDAPSDPSIEKISVTDTSVLYTRRTESIVQAEGMQDHG